MKTDNTYNGYTNYETWAVVLWLENDEGTSRYWRQAASEAKEPGAVSSRLLQNGVWTRKAAASHLLAQRLKDELTEEMPELSPCLYSDLLNAALSEVDWHEVAEAFLED